MPEININHIQPNNINPRLEFPQIGINELAESIKQVGILEPLLVRPTNNSKYEIIIGERRYKAAKLAGLTKVPVIIKDLSDEEVMEINLIENVQREGLTAVEKGKLCKSLLEKYPLRYPNTRSLAKHLGVSETSINDWLYTTSMPEGVQFRIASRNENGFIPEGKIDYITAVQLSRRIKEPDLFTDIIEHISENRVPRRIATQVAKRILQQPDIQVEDAFREYIDEAPVFLPFSRNHAEQVTKGNKTQTTRKSKDPKLQKGTIVRTQVTHYSDIEVSDILRKKLGDFTEEDAQREGGYSLEEFKEVWINLHGSWNPEESVYVIRFKYLNDA